jgi:hypothetical protein
MKKKTGRATKIATETEEHGARNKSSKEDLEFASPVSKEGAAKLLGVSCSTLDQWTAKYGIPHF